MLNWPSQTEGENGSDNGVNASTGTFKVVIGTVLLAPHDALQCDALDIQN